MLFRTKILKENNLLVILLEASYLEEYELRFWTRLLLNDDVWMHMMYILVCLFYLCMHRYYLARLDYPKEMNQTTHDNPFEVENIQDLRRAILHPTLQHADWCNQNQR